MPFKSAGVRGDDFSSDNPEFAQLDFVVRPYQQWQPQDGADWRPSDATGTPRGGEVWKNAAVVVT